MPNRGDGLFAVTAQMRFTQTPECFDCITRRSPQGEGIITPLEKDVLSYIWTFVRQKDGRGEFYMGNERLAKALFLGRGESGRHVINRCLADLCKKGLLIKTPRHPHAPYAYSVNFETVYRMMLELGYYPRRSDNVKVPFECVDDPQKAKELLRAVSEHPTETMAHVLGLEPQLPTSDGGVQVPGTDGSHPTGTDGSHIDDRVNEMLEVIDEEDSHICIGLKERTAAEMGGVDSEVKKDEGRQGEERNECDTPYRVIVSYLNERTGKDFKNTKGTDSLIQARMAEGFTVDDFKKVIDTKVAQWGGDAKMDAYLRPATLFNGEKFEGYLNEHVITNPAEPRQTFVAPSVEEVMGFARDERIQLDSEKFVDYYASKGWLVGRSQSPMRDWKAAARNWARQDKQEKEEVTNVGDRDIYSLL